MPTIRITSYNISGSIDADNRFYSKRGSPNTANRVKRARGFLDKLAMILGDNETDIAALQEVDVCYSGAQTLHQARYLEQTTSMSTAYEAAFDYHLTNHINVTTGIATLSHTPATQRHPVHFGQRRRGLKQIIKARILGCKRALHTTYTFAGQTLHLVNAHLTHNSDRQKHYELQTLVDLCSKLSGKGAIVVLAGDLNCTPIPTRSPRMIEATHFATDQCMDILRDAQRSTSMMCDPRLGNFVECPDVAPLCSYPAGGPTIKLDYVLAFGANVERVVESVLRVEGSNHLPVVADITW